MDTCTRGADELAKAGTTNGETSQYTLQLKDAYTTLEKENKQRWSDAFKTKSEEKGKDYFNIVGRLEDKPWYNYIQLTNRATRTINIHTHPAGWPG
jgi:hypothetical protein